MKSFKSFLSEADGKPDTKEQAIENLENTAAVVKELGRQRAQLAKSRPNFHRDHKLERVMSRLAGARKHFDEDYDNLVALVGQFQAKIILRRIDSDNMTEARMYVFKCQNRSCRGYNTPEYSELSAQEYQRIMKEPMRCGHCDKPLTQVGNQS